MKLLPSLCTPYNHAPCQFMQNHIHKVHVCLSVTCHLPFWQNDWDLLHATAVTRGWNGYQNKSQHRKLTMEKKILLLLLQGLEFMTFQSWVRHSNHWATALSVMWVVGTKRGMVDQDKYKSARNCAYLREVIALVYGVIDSLVPWRHLLSTAGVPFMHFTDTFRAPFEYPNRTSTTEVFTRCTSSLDLHIC